MVHHKTTGGSLFEPKAKSGGSTRRGGVQAGLTAQEGRSDRVARTASRRSEAKDTWRDRKPCVEAKQGAVLGCPFDEENLKFPK